MCRLRGQKPSVRLGTAYFQYDAAGRQIAAKYPPVQTV